MVEVLNKFLFFDIKYKYKIINKFIYENRIQDQDIEKCLMEYVILTTYHCAGSKL